MKEKLVKATYMCVGAFIAFAAYLLGNVNDSINAQPQTQLPVIDKIVVRQLEVVDANGNTIAVLGKRDWVLPGMADILRVYDGAGNSIIVLGQSTDGGMVHVFGKKGTISSASLGISANAGFVQAFDETGGKSVLQGSVVSVSHREGKSGVFLNTDVNGGTMAIFNNGGQNVLQIGVTHTGGGAVNTKDKFGYTTGSVP